jgi:Mg2+ and Co2+ transporter CorA
MRLESAEKRRLLQKQIDKIKVLESSLNRELSAEESEAWRKVQDLAKQLVEKLGEVPKALQRTSTIQKQTQTG